MYHHILSHEAVNWTIEDDEPADEEGEDTAPPPLLNNWGRAQTGGRSC
jgi:hypothetical protein